MFRLFKNGFLNIRLRNLSDSKQAVVGIVVAVLLIGLVVTVLSVIQLIYVPNWMEETESEHIDEVFNQFCQLKLVIDTQSAIGLSNTPIVTSINLGTNKIPFFMSNQAAGALDILDNASYVKIGYVNKTGILNFTSYPLGSIRFTSVNSYYIPTEQISFVYENGALITDQKSGYSLNIIPFFKCEYNENDNYTISFSIINISGVGGKISKYGYDIDHIRTELYKDEIFNNKINPINNVTNLTITTKYHEIWYSFINASLRKGELIYGQDYERVDGGSGNYFCIEFYNPLVIELKCTGLYAQIGPGWIDVK